MLVNITCLLINNHVSFYTVYNFVSITNEIVDLEEGESRTVYKPHSQQRRESFSDEDNENEDDDADLLDFYKKTLNGIL